MKQFAPSSLHQFEVVGSNFTKADTNIRSLFAITPAMMEEVYARAKDEGLSDFFVLSTCNRTEFYACAPKDIIRSIVTDSLRLRESDFENYFYVYSGEEAVRHLFRVSAGLDSQILGDYEIVGQLKIAIKKARQYGMIGTITDRISSLAFQASREIKANTNLSSGKYSVSFAAAELLSEYHPIGSAVKILIVGLGKFGQTLARNMREYFFNGELTLCNRTPEHSENLAQELQTHVLPFENFTEHLTEFDVVIAAAQSDQYLIRTEHVASNSSTIFLDLGIPHLIDPQIKFTINIKLYSVDDVSEFHNNLMQQRYTEVPKAERILDDFIGQLRQWQNVFFHRDIIRKYKDRVHQFVPAGTGDHQVDKLFSGFIQKIRINGYQGCLLIETLNEIMVVQE